MRILLAWVCILGFAISDVIAKGFERTKKEVDYKVKPDPLWLALLVIWRYPKRLLHKLAELLYSNLH